MSDRYKPDVPPYVIREIRGNLFKPPVVVFYDRAAIAAMPVNKLRALVAQGVISEQRLESLPATAESMPPPRPPRAAAAVSGAGDFVTGASASYVLRADATFTVDSGYVSTPTVPGPHVLTDVRFQIQVENVPVVLHHVYCDIRFSDLPITTDSAWVKATSVFDYVQPVTLGWIAEYPIEFVLPDGALDQTFHIDRLIELQSSFYTLHCSSSAGLSNRVRAFITTRPAATSVIPRIKVPLATPLAHLTAPPSAPDVRATQTRNNAPVVHVVKSTTKEYVAFMPDKMFLVQEDDLSVFSSRWRPLSLVPRSQMQSEWNRLFMSGVSMDYSLGTTALTPFLPTAEIRTQVIPHTPRAQKVIKQHGYTEEELAKILETPVYLAASTFGLTQEEVKALFGI